MGGGSGIRPKPPLYVLISGSGCPYAANRPQAKYREILKMGKGENSKQETDSHPLSNLMGTISACCTLLQIVKPASQDGTCAPPVGLRVRCCKVPTACRMLFFGSCRASAISCTPTRRQRRRATRRSAWFRRVERTSYGSWLHGASLRLFVAGPKQLLHGRSLPWLLQYHDSV